MALLITRIEPVKLAPKKGGLQLSAPLVNIPGPNVPSKLNPADVGVGFGAGVMVGLRVDVGAGVGAAFPSGLVGAQPFASAPFLHTLARQAVQCGETTPQSPRSRN